MTAPRLREQHRPPAPPDRRPPRRGGGSSSSTYAESAAVRPASLVRSTRMLAAAALLALSGALALPATAQAQEIALVSNMSESGDTIATVNPVGFQIGGIDRRESRSAQRFTTGPNPAGYSLQSVVLNLSTNLGSGNVVHVAIHEDSSGNPGTLLVVLDNPADPFGNDPGTAGNRTFSAPSPLSLGANAQYWVVLKNTRSGTGANNYGVRLTPSHNETTTQGFNIRNSYHGGTPGNWSESSQFVVKVEIRGTLLIPPGLEVTLHLSNDEPLEHRGWITVTATVSPASPVPFTVTVSADPVAPATDDDFRLSSNQVLSFAANATESTGTVRIGLVNDDDPEPPDVVTVSGTVSNAAIPDPDDVTLTIINDDPDFPQDIAIDAPAAVDEDAGTATVTVTLTTRQNSAPVIDVELYYYWRQETATRGEDYRPPSGEVFVSHVLFATVPTSAFSAAGTAYVANRTFTIGIVDDQEAEADETIVFFVRTSSDTSPDHTITIRDDDAVVPGTPTGLTAFPKSQTRIQLAWTAPANYGSFAITGYRIEASEDGRSSWDVVARTRDARTDFRHGRLTAGDTRHYRVSAISDAGSSSPSNLARATTLAAGPAATNPNLPPPADVTAVPKLPGQIRLGWWTPLIGGGQIDEYKYRRRVAGASGWTNWNTVNATTGFHSRFVNGLDTATSYEFQVRSVARDDTYSTAVSALATATGRQTISIEVDPGPVTEGEPLRFTVSRDQPHGPLMVIVRLSETGDMLSQEGNRGNPDTQHEEVRLGDGNTTKRLVVETVNDRGGPESDSRITAEVMPYPLHPGNPDNEKLYAVHASRGSVKKRVAARVPPTCTPNPGDLWCGVVTVGETTGAYGYNEFRDVGYLSDTDFDVGTNSHTIEAIIVDSQTTATPGALTFTFDSSTRPTTAAQDILVLHVGGAAFAFSDPSSVTGGRNFIWDDAGLDWSGKEYVIARLREASSAQRALQGRFVSPPERHDGKKRIKVRVEFSEPVEESPENVGEHGVEVEGGEVTSVSPVGGDAPDGAGTRSVGGRNAGREDREVVWEFEIEPDSDGDLTISLDAGRPCGEPGAICTADGRSLSEGISTTVEGPEPGPEPLTAAFEGMPEAHDGESAFRFHVAFSENIGISYRSLREDAFAVTGGRVTRGRRVDDRRDLFEMTVEPDGGDNVTITLPASRECGVSGAICTKGENRRQLTNTPTATVAGPEAGSGPVPLTARFVGMPAEHRGKGGFRFRVAFSEPIRMSGRRLRADVVAVAGGRATKARPVNGRKDRWDLTVKPDSRADVTITLAAGAACDTPAAVCTKRQPRRPLTTTLATTVPGPVALTVADARAEEGIDKTLDFAVSLSRAVSRTVTVAYATADGTARAGADYTRTRGTLKFAPGETVKTVRVPVLDDAHDEGEETLTFRLSTPSGAVLADGVATGTIENSDSLQQAWLARFGRTAATHVTDAVSDRLRGTPGQESHVTVGGYRLPVGQPDAVDGADDGVSGVERLVLALGQRLGLGTGTAPAGAGGVAGAGGWPDAPVATDPRLGQSRTLDVGNALNLRQVLLGSSFRLAFGRDDVGSGWPRLTAWGRVAGTTFDGRDGDLTLNGDVLTGTVGVDGEWDRLLAGLAVAHSRGDGSYIDTEAQGRGDLEQTLTSVHPYLRYAVTDRLAVWGLLGYGTGQVEMELGPDETRETDTNLVMGAFGGRGILLAAPDSGGFQLATRTDAMLTRTTSDKVQTADGNMASGDAEAHRLRLVLEGSRGFAWAEGRRLTPTMEVGLRHDWGDAETGFGLELGGRVQYADPALGLTIDAAVRGLLAHEDSDYQEWGASGTVRIDPGAGGQGLSLTLAPAWGATASGVDGLWSRQTTAGLAPQGNRAAPVGRLNAEVGYGFAPFGAGLLTPYAGTVLSDGAARTYRVGGRLQLNGGWATGLALNLEGMRQEPAGQQPVNQGLRLQITWGF